MKYPKLFSNALIPPVDVTLDISDTNVSWLDKEGIYCSVGLEDPKKQTVEEMKAYVAEWVKKFPYKLCLLLMVDGRQQSDKETRDAVAEILPQVTKAMALVVESKLARMASNMFFRINKQDYPIKVFTNVEDAKKWLRQYLQK